MLRVLNRGGLLLPSVLGCFCVTLFFNPSQLIVRAQESSKDGVRQAESDTAIRRAIENRDMAGAFEALKNLPIDKRMEYIGPLSELMASTSNRYQSGSSSGSSSSGVGALPPVGNGETGLADGNARGGVSRADFTELINLIQNTIDGRWDEGTDTIEPFPSGVWIDTNGAIKMTRDPKNMGIKALEQPKREAIRLPGLGVFQESAALRWVSLTELERELAERVENQKPSSLSMELLGGLTRIDYVAWNEQSKEWLLGGPAGDILLDANGELVGSKTKLPPVLLEDLLSVAPHVLNGRGPLGCSIDPVPEKLKAAADFIGSKNSRQELAKNPTKWTRRLLDIIGPQQVSIFGIPNDSPAGAALIMADHHLKRLGLGLEPGPAGLTNYLLEAEKRDAYPDQGMVRWWFAIKPAEIGIDEQRLVFELPKQPVDLLSEQQWADQRGQRAATGKADVAADGFAQDFTARFDDVCEKYPIYGRLRHVFSLAIALEVIRGESQGNAERELKMLSNPEIQPHLRVRPQWIDSVSTTRTIPGKRTVAIVSGGVKLDVRGVRNSYRAADDLPESTGLPTREMAKHEAWWR